MRTTEAEDIIGRVTTKVYLGGGGSERDEAALWDEFLTPGQRIVYWPFALPPDKHDSAEQWLSSALGARGEFRLELWPDLSDRSVDDLADVDVLFVGGGNTFALLDEIQRHDYLSAIRGYVRNGGVLYGGSAGAIFAGADIAIAEPVDPNDVGLTDTTGLDLIGGLVVRPHYDDRRLDELREWATDTGQSILAIPERGGVAVLDTTARNIGPEPVHVIGPANRRSYDAGVSWPLDG